MPTTKQLEAFTQQVRRDILRMIHKVNSGHPGGSLGCAEYLSVLYQEIMNYDSQNFDIDGIGEDLFFLSNGHISAVLYSVLARSGYFSVSELATFRMMNSRLQGHPTNYEGLPGIRIASGSLGQGMSIAIGAAQSKKLNGDDALIYSLHGDGELQEGQNWEAIMYASSKKIDNYIAAIDVNFKQIDGDTDQIVSLGSLKKKFESFDWKVIEIKRGNDIDSIVSGIKKAKKLTRNEQPICILLYTEMGNGVDFMMQTNAWHGKAPNDAELKLALAQNSETIGDY